MQIRPGPIVCLALVLAASGFVPGARVRASQQKPASDAKTPAPPTSDQSELLSVSQMIDAVSAGTQPPPTDIAVSWVSNHFIKSQGDSVYIPFTISVNRSQLSGSAAAVFIRVVSNAPASTSSST